LRVKLGAWTAIIMRVFPQPTSQLEPEYVPLADPLVAW
jgi:hypothetical protein